MELELQKYLRSGKKPEELTTEFAIAVKRHGTYPNLVMFKYNQIDSPMGNPLVQECRGIILDEKNNWKVVCYTYKKFFNSSEGHAEPIDFSNAQYLEKLDGSLTQVFYYDNQWLVASSGSPDASGEVNDHGITFKDLFWQTWKQLGYQMPKNTTICYAFELMTKYNRIIVVHDKPRIVMHGARCLNTLQELHPRVVAIGEDNNWEYVQSFPLKSLADCSTMADSLDPIKQEGFVIVGGELNAQGNFPRQKLKSPQYVALHHLTSHMSNKRLLEIARVNEGAEFLAYFAEWKDAYEDIKQKLSELVKTIESQYATMSHIPYLPQVANAEGKFSYTEEGKQLQKQFAMLAAKAKYAGVLFSLRNGDSASVRAYLKEMNIKLLMDWLHLKDKELVTTE